MSYLICEFYFIPNTGKSNIRALVSKESRELNIIIFISSRGCAHQWYFFLFIVTDALRTRKFIASVPARRLSTNLIV